MTASHLRTGARQTLSLHQYLDERIAVGGGVRARLGSHRLTAVTAALVLCAVLTCTAAPDRLRLCKLFQPSSESRCLIWLRCCWPHTHACTCCNIGRVAGQLHDQEVVVLLQGNAFGSLLFTTSCFERKVFECIRLPNIIIVPKFLIMLSKNYE